MTHLLARLSRYWKTERDPFSTLLQKEFRADGKNGAMILFFPTMVAMLTSGAHASEAIIPASLIAICYGYALSATLNQTAFLQALADYHNIKGSFSGLRLEHLLGKKLDHEFAVNLSSTQVLNRAVQALTRMKQCSSLSLDLPNNRVYAMASTSPRVRSQCNITITTEQLGDCTRVKINCSPVWTEAFAWATTMQSALSLEKEITEEFDPENFKGIPKKIHRACFTPANYLRLRLPSFIIGLAFMFFAVGTINPQLDTRALAYYEAGSYQQAYDTIRLSSASSITHSTLLAQILSKLNKREQADRVFKEAATDSFEDSYDIKELKAQQALIYALQNRQDDAQTLIDKLQADHTMAYGEASALNMAQGQLQRLRNNLKDALFSLNTAAAVGTESRDLLALLAETNRCSGKLKDAASYDSKINKLTDRELQRLPWDDLALLVCGMSGFVFLFALVRKAPQEFFRVKPTWNRESDSELDHSEGLNSEVFDPLEAEFNEYLQTQTNISETSQAESSEEEEKEEESVALATKTSESEISLCRLQ